MGRRKYEATRTQHDVGENLVLGHLDVADSNTQAENLLKLELDRRLDFDDLVAEVLSVRDRGGELASCSESENQLCGESAQVPTFGKTGTKETGNLLDQSFGSKKSVVLFGELLDELLVLVEPEQDSQ